MQHQPARPTSEFFIDAHYRPRQIEKSFRTSNFASVNRFEEPAVRSIHSASRQSGWFIPPFGGPVARICVRGVGVGGGGAGISVAHAVQPVCARRN